MMNTLLRRAEVEHITGMSRSSIYRLMHAGTFPAPVRVGTRAVRWRWRDIEAWVEACPLAE